MNVVRAQWAARIEASRENSTPTRVKARDWINNALRDGRIEKPEHCQGRDCKNTDTKAHHYDYRTKDKVKWYCSDCHEKADSKHGSAVRWLAKVWVTSGKTPRIRVLLTNGKQPEIVEAVETESGDIVFIDTLGERHPASEVISYREIVPYTGAKANEWKKLTKPVRCRTVADHPQWHGSPDEYETYNDRPQIKVDTEGQVVAWLKGEMVPNGYNKIPDTYGYGLGPKVQTSDSFLVQFPNTSGPVILMEDQIELLDPIPRRKTAIYAPAAMHVYWDDPQTGEVVQGDYCLDHGFEVLADKRALPYYKNVGFFHHMAEISPGSICILCADERNDL